METVTTELMRTWPPSTVMMPANVDGMGGTALTAFDPTRRHNATTATKTQRLFINPNLHLALSTNPSAG
jgi:hypothetical protein